jgi:hypothetical protein
MQERPLADEFFLFGHDLSTGKALVGDNVLDTGLAGAMLGELFLADRLTVDAELLVTVHDQRSAQDAVADKVLAEIMVQGERYPVRQWVEYLRGHAREMVATRLEEAGLIERVQTRAVLRTTVRYPALDAMKAAAIAARLRYVLDRPSELDLPTATLACLIAATGLDFAFGRPDAAELRETLARMSQLLTPDLQALTVGVETSVARLALRARP